MTPETRLWLRVVRRLLRCPFGHHWLRRVEPGHQFLECQRCLTTTPGVHGPTPL